MDQARTLPQPLSLERRAGTSHGIKAVIGSAAWNTLPAAVQERFADTAGAATYGGGYEVVRAHWLGRMFAWLGLLFGMPVTPRSGTQVRARVRVRPGERGTCWEREYHWADGRRDVVRSTKVVTRVGNGDRRLIEVLPARLCMPLDTYVQGRVLHFVSLGYYFDLGAGFRLWLPRAFSPGVTHVEHIDLGHGWFRFTMTVTHPWFGEMFFQTGRFCAEEDCA